MFYYNYVTSVGQKQINQDALLIRKARFRNSEILLSAVCDGIGGLSGGEIASAFVISGLADWFKTEFAQMKKQEASVLEIRQNLDTILHEMNDALNQSHEMGTTLTGFILDSGTEKMLIVHAGDTRLYQIFSDHICMVTEDHSVVAEELRQGLLTEEQARQDSRQNQITNCIGAGETSRNYDYIIRKPEKNCIYLLCSDGFRKLISKDEIFRFLSPDENGSAQKIQENLQTLLNLNLSRGEQDNITAVAVSYR